MRNLEVWIAGEEPMVRLEKKRIMCNRRSKINLIVWLFAAHLPPDSMNERSKIKWVQLQIDRDLYSTNTKLRRNSLKLYVILGPAIKTEIPSSHEGEHRTQVLYVHLQKKKKYCLISTER